MIANLYDYPRYYDLVFGSDWKAEHDFLLAVFDTHAAGRVRRVFEPACGTGRLLFRLAQSGLAVSGLDLNPRAVDFCNKRLLRHGFPATAVVGDMADFRLRAPVDAAFNTINGIPCHEHEELFKVLRAWGFDGVVISDWTGIAELIPHGVAADRKQAAYLAFKAGVDVDMASGMLGATRS